MQATDVLMNQDVREFLEQIGDRYSVIGRVNPTFSREQDGKVYRMFDKVHTVDHLRVFVEAELGRRIGDGSGDYQPYLVTEDDVKAFETICKKKSPALVETLKTEGGIPVGRLSRLLKGTKSVQGPIVDDREDKTLKTIRVASVLAQYDLDLDEFKDPVWKDFVAEVKKRYAVEIGLECDDLVEKENQDEVHIPEPTCRDGRQKGTVFKSSVDKYGSWINAITAVNNAGQAMERAIRGEISRMREAYLD